VNTATELSTVPARLDKARKCYGSRAVLDGVDLSVAAGSVVGLLGRNGAGKSTLIRCLLGIQELDSGTARLFDEPTLAISDAIKGRIGYVPQEPDAFSWMKVGSMLDYFAAFYQRWDRDQVQGMLDAWSIRRDAVIGTLSAGEKQRLAIVRALAHHPDLLVLDEPVASLDPLGRREFLREIVTRASERGTTVLFSTHITSDLERVAVSVAFLKNGKIVLHDELDRLRERLRRLRIPLPQSAPESRIEVPGLVSLKRDAFGALTAIADIGDEELAALGRRWGGPVAAESLSLEDLFIELER
jgi:ABC-2 type transport system ATP-binding protein